MPIYEYRCDACAKRVELLQRRRAGPRAAPPACPACGASRLRPLVSAFAFTSEAEWDGFEGMDDLDADDPEAVSAFTDRLAEQTGQPGLGDALGTADADLDVDF